MFLLVPRLSGCESDEGLWGGPTHRNAAFQLYLKLFGFLSANLAEWLDFAEEAGDNKEAESSHHSVCLCLPKHKERSQGAEI